MSEDDQQATDQDDGDEELNEVSLKEPLKDAIANPKPRRAHGLHAMPPELLQSAARNDQFLTALAGMVKNRRSQHSPTSWKQSVGFLLRKHCLVQRAGDCRMIACWSTLGRLAGTLWLGVCQTRRRRR